MASFTDQISQFNPYIQELPVEAMAQVGMAKQAQYDQGVKKVQNYIDRVAGLEIAKGPHKQYLQSKMDELGSRLKTVAAGDFSNQQLVNSVSGMTGQIIKDPIIQNAVYSTQVLKKGNADREAAAKAGKTSPNNDQDWEDQKVQLLNDGYLNTPFTGKFIEHWDVDKKLSDKAEQIMKYPDEFVADNPWKRDDAGNVLYFGTEVVKGPDGKAVIDPKTKQPVTRQIESTDPSKGQKQIDDAMLKISAKGTSAEKLYNNFLDSLDSRDAQQLRIDAKAAYRNVKPEAFARDAINVYEGRKKLQNQQMVNIAVALKEPNLTDVQKATLTARLNDLQASEKEGLLDKELNSVLEAIKNPAVLDKYKENLYTQKRLMNMATDMAYKSYKQELSTNPYAQMYMQKQNFNLEVKKFADDSRRGWANIDIARANQNLAERKFLYEMSKDAKEEAAKNPKPVITTTTLSTDIVPRTVDDEKKEVENLDNEIVSLKEEYGDTLFPNLVGIDNKWIALDNLINRYDTNPKAEYSPDELKFLQKYKDLNDKYLTKGKLVQNAEKFKETTRTALIKSKVDAGNSGFDNTEIADIAEQIKKFEKKDKFTVGTVMDKEAAKQFFTTYKGGKYLDAANSYMAEIRGINWFNNKGLNSQQLATARAIDKAAGTLSNIDEEVSTKTSEFLGKYSPKNLAQDAALDMNNEKTKAAVNKYLTSVALTDKSIGAGDASTVLKWQTGEDGGKMKVAIRKLSDGTTQAIFVKPDGSNTITLPMSTNQREFFPEIKETNPYASWIDATKASVKGTTDVMDNRTPEVTDAFAVTARKTGFDVPGFANNTKLAPLVRFTLEANQSNIGDDNDTYSLIMYAKGAKDTTWKGRRISDGYVPFGGIQNILNAVDDRAYYEIIKSKK